MCAGIQHLMAHVKMDDDQWQMGKTKVQPHPLPFFTINSFICVCTFYLIPCPAILFTTLSVFVHCCCKTHSADTLFRCSLRTLSRCSFSKRSASASSMCKYRLSHTSACHSLFTAQDTLYTTVLIYLFATRSHLIPLLALRERFRRRTGGGRRSSTTRSSNRRCVCMLCPRLVVFCCV